MSARVLKETAMFRCSRTRPFEILMFRPDATGSEAVRTVRRRSRVAARVTARKLLAPHARHCTRATWHQAGRYLWTADIWAPGGTHETIEAERIEGPSVADVGAW